MLPQGMFSVAVATVLFPSLARLASRRDMDGFRRMVARGTRQIAFLLIPASIACAVLADPIVRVVYQRGDFTAAQTPATAGALAAFSLGLAFNGFMLMFNRAFFSLQRPWLPTWVALGNLGLNAVLDAAFYRFGIWGIPLSTSLVNIAGTAALVILLQRELGGSSCARRSTPFSASRSPARALGLVSYGVWRGLHSALGARSWPRSWACSPRSAPGSACTSSSPVCCGFASSRRSCRCGRAFAGPDRIAGT